MALLAWCAELLALAGVLQALAGWAATAAYIAPLSPSWRLAFEAMHVSSDRPERDEIGLPPRQRQSILQSSLKYGF